MQIIADIAEQPEFDKLWDNITSAYDDQFIGTATEYGVARWESMLGLQPKASENLDSRKFRITSVINETLPYTYTMLEQTLEMLCEEDGYVISIEPSNYTIDVKVAMKAKTKYDEVKALLDRVVPANMVINLSLKYNQHSLLAEFTHREFKGRTHNELRNEEL